MNCQHGLGTARDLGNAIALKWCAERRGDKRDIKKFSKQIEQLKTKLIEKGMNDTQRLDWLEKHPNVVVSAYGGWRQLFGRKDKSNWWPTLREAIDAVADRLKKRRMQ